MTRNRITTESGLLNASPHHTIGT